MSRELIQSCVELLWDVIQHSDGTQIVNLGLDEVLHSLRSLTHADSPPEHLPREDDYRATPAYKAITERFGVGMKLRDLILAAYVVADGAQISPPLRQEKRQKEKLYWWFDRHWAVIAPLWPGFRIEHRA
jgi:hypothetical protein